MNHRRVTLISCLTLSLLAGGSIFAQEDVRVLLRQIELEKDDVPPSVIRDLAKIGTPEAWKALYKSLGILKKSNKLNVAYLSFKHFNGKVDLEKKSIDCLLEEINSQSKVSLARLAVSAMRGLMPSAEKHLLRIAESHKDSQCRALALKPLMSYVRQNRNSKTLFLLLDNFIPKKSGKSIDFVEAVELYPLLEYRNEVKKRLLDEDYSVILKLLILEVLRGDKSQGLDDLALLCLGSEVPSIVLSSLQVAQGHGLPLGKPTLSRLCKHDDPAVRMTAHVTLVQNLEDVKRVEKQVSRWAKSRDSVQRQAAANAYGLLPMEACIPGLKNLMRDNSFAVRHDALQALQQLRHPMALEALIDNLDQSDKMTLEITQKLLSGLTGERFGPSQSTWSRWWEDHRVGFTFPTKEEAENRLRKLNKKSSQGDTGAAFFGLPVVSQHVAFVIDTSSSMLTSFSSSSRYGGSKGTRLSAAKEQLLEALAKMPDGARFNILNFDLAGKGWQDSLVKLNSKTRSAAQKHIKNLESRGATAMFDALELAFSDEQVDIIFLLSDGMPSGGKIDDPDLILNEIRRWNMTRRIPIHCISIGGPTSLLKAIAQETSGNFLQVK